jgi:hypothetical protein
MEDVAWAREAERGVTNILRRVRLGTELGY